MALLHKAASKAGTRTSEVLVLLAIGNLLCLQCNSQGIVVRKYWELPDIKDGKTEQSAML